MKIESLLDLFDHMAWADAEIWRAVLASEQARQDTKIRDTLLHLHTAQRIYLRVWQDKTLETPPQFEQLSTLCEWAMVYHGEVHDFIKSLTDAHMSSPISTTWVERVEKVIGPAQTVPTLGDSMAQVPLHSQYHRGQVNARLRAVGEAPPMVDYIMWVWSGRPVAKWPN